MTDTAAALTIQQRLIAVMDELEAIPKNGTAPASQGGYAFRRFEDIASTLKPLFAKNGLHAPLASVRDSYRDVRTVGNGKSMYVIGLEIEWTIGDENGESIRGRMWGEGTDMGDKATQKAVTASLKSFLTPLFLIADEGDDSEAHDTQQSEPAPQPLTPGQQLAQRKAAWGDRPLPEGWDSFEAMDEKHEAFKAGVTSLSDDLRKQVADFRTAQGIPWPMSVSNMDEMLAEVIRLRTPAAEGDFAGDEAENK